MALWIEWFAQVSALRGACTNVITYGWMILTLIGFAIRPERVGVTSFVRVLGFKEASYKSFLNFFHSKALNLNVLTNLWIGICFKLFTPLSEDGCPVLAGDGIKVAKEGRKMPAVKSLHQESNDNSKPEYIMGHSLQAICLLAKSICGTVFAVPLVSRIHEGIVVSNRDQRTIVDRMAELLKETVRVLWVSLSSLLPTTTTATKRLPKRLVRSTHFWFLALEKMPLLNTPPHRIPSVGEVEKRNMEKRFCWQDSSKKSRCSFKQQARSMVKAASGCRTTALIYCGDRSDTLFTLFLSITRTAERSY